MGRYIVDVVSRERMLIVELDGGQHANQREYDDERTRWLESRGFKVLRFWNNDVLQHPDWVLDAIWQSLEGRTPEPPSP